MYIYIYIYIYIYTLYIMKSLEISDNYQFEFLKQK